MSRIARIVIEGIPYHVTQRGNARQQVFFEDRDYFLYRDLLQTNCQDAGLGAIVGKTLKHVFREI